MKTIAAVALGVGLFASAALAGAQDKKDAAPKLDGKYSLVAGKRDGKEIGDDAKKAEYTFTADKVTIKSNDFKFVMGYKVDPKTKPVSIDMEILEGPEGTKGSKAQGIVEAKGDVLKLAYTLEKDKRPKDFEGKSGFMFEFKKAK